MNHFTVKRLLAFSFSLMGLYAYAQQPTNHPTLFAAATQSGSSIQLTWTGSTGANLPTHYIVLARIVPAGTFPVPADGTPIADDANLIDDNLGAINVVHAVGANSTTFTGLPVDTDFEFIIYPYKTGGATDPLFKNNGTPLLATASTRRPTVTSPTHGTANEDSNTLGGTVTSDGGNALTERGTVWKTSAGVTASDNALAEGGMVVSAFNHSRTGFPHGTQIFYAAYATNVAGTFVSPESSFFTIATTPDTQPAAVTATAVSTTQINLSFSSAASTGANTKGYIIVRNTGSAPPGAIAQDGVEPGSIVLGTCTLVTTITNLGTTTYNDTGLTPNTDYYYAVIPFNWDNVNPETYNYRLGTGFTVDNDVTFSASSDIVLTGSGGGTSSNINYRARLGPTIDNDGGNSTSLATFQVRDGGAGTDADNVGTTLTSVTVQITNFANLRRVALFDNGDEVAGTEQDAASSVTFDLSSYGGPNGPLTTTDGGTNNFTIRGVFQSAVVDNQSVHILVTAATALSTGSQFAAVNAGGATTTTAGASVNNIVVTATRLRFTAAPTAGISQNFSLTVRAVDNSPHYNTDLDYTGQVRLAITNGPPTGDLTNAGTTNLDATLVNGTFTWTQLQIDVAGSYDIEGSDDDVGGSLNDAPGTVTITSTSVSITAPTLNTLCYGGAFQSLGNIVITEVDAQGFSSGGSLLLSLPSGYVFDQSVTTAPTVGGGSDISAPTALSYSAANIVQFSYTISGTANVNSITISGLRVRYPGNTSPPAETSILRIGGTAIIAGDQASDGKSHGTVSVNQPSGPALGFVVTSSDGVSVVSPNETNFSVGSNPVNLIGNQVGGTSVFEGSGVTLVGSQYRFNPSSLAPGTYPITYRYTDPSPSACQFTFTKVFTVYSSGINNLAPTYCTNDDVTSALSVDGTVLAQMGPNFIVDRFVYYDFNFGWRDIANPDSVRFDPKLDAYKPIYNQSPAYGYPTAIFIGYYVCDPTVGSPYPCNNTSTRFGRYQMVEMRPAPNVDFSLPTFFCEDDAPVTLIGDPVNSANTTKDNFTADGGQNSSITFAAADSVWTFSPAAVSGVTSSNSQTFNITYKYTDPVTACDNTKTYPITIHDRPTIVPASAISPGAPHSIVLCQGSSVGSFTTSDNTYTYRWYSDNPTTDANRLTTGSIFNPPVDNTLPGTTLFYVTRDRNGCESSNNPLTISVVVNPTPPPPTVADPTLEYCINDVIPDIVATGSTIRWYDKDRVFIIGDPSPSATQLGINNTVAGTYTFYATQTANGCEGFIPGTATLVTVTIKALPNLAILPNDDITGGICTTGGNISFQAIDQNDGNPAPNGTWSGAGLSGVLNPFPVQGKTELNPLTLSPGDYTLEYDYTSAASGCSNTQTIGLTILPTITPSVSVGDVCDGFPAIITNNSSINPGSSSSTIEYTGWTLGDGSGISQGISGDPIPATTNTGRTSGTYFNPTHIYPNTGTFQISGWMVTSDECVYAIPQQPVTVSPIPVVKFGWINACRGVTSSTQFLAVETSSPQVPIAQYNWDFNLNNTLTYSSAGTGNSPTVNYDIDGTDVVRLIAISPAQCRDTVDVPVYIVPSYPTITEDNAYAQDFDAGTDGWIAGGINSSWAHGNPQGSTVVGDASVSGTGNAWDTNLTGISNNGEQSWVLSPCFDFTVAQKPIISFDIWSDTQFQNDGAVLQYNSNGNILNDAAWITIGQDDGQGANWYDESGISSSPGNQAANDLGWTGVYGGWKKAAYKLDNLKGLSNVVFRVAFASNVPRRGEGFTFDNVFIGERSRTVLLESFTNSSAAANSTLHNNIFRAFSTGSQEVAKIQFHTSFPGNDPLNQANVELNNSRAAFYGITNAKVFSVDGTVVSTSAALNTLYDARVLTPSPLRIDINMTKDGELVRINSTLTNTTNAPFPTAGVNVFTVIVEKTITDDNYLGSGDDDLFKFVAKEMLPTPAGVMLEQGVISPLETIAVPEVVWKNRDLISSDSGAVVVYVQSIEGGNKNVYQAKIEDATDEPDMVTGLEPAFADQIIVYPNPATGEMNVRLPSKSSQSLPVTLTDNFGRTVFTNIFKPGEQVKTIITREFAAGVYILQIKSEKGEMARKKVMVVNR